MAKRIFKTAYSKARKAAGAPGRAIAGAYYGSKVRANKRKNDQIVDDVKTLREMDRSGVEMGSPSDPYSRARRTMRVDSFKREMEEKYPTKMKKVKKSKRLFRNS